MKLRDLKVGDQAVVVGYEESDSSYRSKLLAMGLTRGSIVKVIKVAPLGDPVKIEVRGYDLSLRKAEADALLVESGQ
jgi:ferrous iron transport protein A